MNILKLIFREIAHSRLLYAAGILAAALSAGIAMSTMLMLRNFDGTTSRILAEKEEASRAAWQRFENNVRKTMLELGFNLKIIPEEQSVSTPDDKALYLPETYAAKLKQSRLMSINHVLPYLQKKVWWPERKRWVTLYGTPGEIQIKNPAKQTPMVQTMQNGRASLGRGIYESTGLKEGDTFNFTGRKFTVEECRPGESYEADEQIRIPLKEAQQILKLDDKISGIMAVNCLCADPRGLAGIRRDIATLLPGAKVLEHSSHRLVRVEERARAAREADAALAREKKSRARLRAERRKFAAALLPFTAAVAAVWLALISWINVRRRLPEMAVLRALGRNTTYISALVLGKALLTGLPGGIIGVAVGFVAFNGLSINTAADSPATGLTALIITAATVLLALLAAWIPALQAALTDPAKILNEEG